MTKAFIYILIYLLVVLFQQFLCWWAFIFPCLAIGVIGKTQLKSFFIGFITIFSCWIFAYAFYHYNSNGLLSGKIAQMLYMPNAAVLYLSSSFMAALVAGVSSLLGFYLNNLRFREE